MCRGHIVNCLEIHFFLCSDKWHEYLQRDPTWIFMIESLIMLKMISWSSISFRRCLSASNKEIESFYYYSKKYRHSSMQKVKDLTAQAGYILLWKICGLRKHMRTSCDKSVYGQLGAGRCILLVSIIIENNILHSFYSVVLPLSSFSYQFPASLCCLTVSLATSDSLWGICKSNRWLSVMAMKVLQWNMVRRKNVNELEGEKAVSKVKCVPNMD